MIRLCLDCEKSYSCMQIIINIGSVEFLHSIIPLNISSLGLSLQLVHFDALEGVRSIWKID